MKDMLSARLISANRQAASTKFKGHWRHCIPDKYLALNAAVEPQEQVSRKGSPSLRGGKKSCARFSNAAKETKELMKTPCIKVEAGTKMQTIQPPLDRIVEHVKKQQVCHDIAAASNEQSLGVEQNNQASFNIPGCASKCRNLRGKRFGQWRAFKPGSPP